jgi:glutamate/aspartate transport system substrate-binding protein
MRRVGSAVAFVLLLATLVGAQDTEGTLRKIKESGTIRLGFREQSLPFSFLGKDSLPSGYSVDLCTRVVAGIQQELRLPKLDVKWVPVTPETRIPSLLQDTIDLECGSTTNTLSRQEQVDFSHMTFIDGTSLLVKADSGIGRLQDTASKRIAVVSGTTTEKVLRNALQRAFINAEIVPVTDHRPGLVAVENGAADAYASDRIILIGLAATSQNPRSMAVADQYLSYEPYALMPRRDPAFRLSVNRVLSRLYRSGEVMSVYDRWFRAAGPAPGLLLAMYALHGLPD